jgi:uncharacterized membrane protein YphA (DoxX/SURF4 family)
MAAGHSAVVDLIARLLLALVFLQAIPGKITGFQETAAMIAQRGLPAAPLLLAAAVALMLVGSLLLLLGVRLRLAVILLLVFLVPTTLLFHLEPGDPSQRIALFKNLAIIGGLLMVANRPSRPRAGRRRRRRRPAAAVSSDPG